MDEWCVHHHKKSGLFIDKYLPILSKRLSYQMVDVTAIGLVCAQQTVHANKPRTTYAHTAAADINESMLEYKYYMEQLFVKDFGPDESIINQYYFIVLFHVFCEMSVSDCVCEQCPTLSFNWHHFHIRMDLLAPFYFNGTVIKEIWHRNEYNHHNICSNVVGMRA
jgi:hypothetical protein